MSTIMQFMPMNLRLYDREVRELRTYVSPLFSCATDPSSMQGGNTHLAADNGGGKSTLLLFFELLFCKPGSQTPKVSGKRVIDYLRRAAEELGDTTPTTMAVLVRRDARDLMDSARDVVFGYTVALRGDGASIDLRRFVIPIAECPGLSLERLARECVYGTDGRPFAAREVRAKLAALDGCQLFDSSEWDEYVARMTDAGISPILWRELARMNEAEEAAESYFRTGDAFRKIVGLVYEAQQPASGERSMDIAVAAADVARQVSTQESDRILRGAHEKAAEDIESLAGCVRDYADAREGRMRLQIEARDALDVLQGRSKELAEQLEAIEADSGSFRRRRDQNERMRLSSKIWRAEKKLATQQERVASLKMQLDELDLRAKEADKAVRLDDAAASYERYRSVQEELRVTNARIEVLRGDVEANKVLSDATRKAWRKLMQAEAFSRKALEAAQKAYEDATVQRKEAEKDYAHADRELSDCDRFLGRAQAQFDSTMERVAEISRDIPDFGSVQPTLAGPYLRDTLEQAIRDAESLAGRRKRELAAAEARVEQTVCVLDVANTTLRDAELLALAKAAEAQEWRDRLSTAESMDAGLRSATALWEDVTELLAIGSYDEAGSLLGARVVGCRENERRERAAEQAALRRLEALGSGRLEMSDGLRGWLDRNGIRARTLASHTGMSEAERDALFAAHPWLAHALVVDERDYASLEDAAGGDDLSELGHAVFYVRQSDVHHLLDAATSPSSPLRLVGTDGQPLVGSLRTVDRAYLEDPEGYERGLRRRISEAQREAEELARVAALLERAQGEMGRLLAFLTAIDMPGRTLADVSARSAQADGEAKEAEAKRRHAEDEARAADSGRKAAIEKRDQANSVLADAEARRDALAKLQVHNDRCLTARTELERAEVTRAEVLRKKERALSRQEHSRQDEIDRKSDMEMTQRESAAIASLRNRVEAASASAEPQGLGYTPDAPCKSAELEVSVKALEDIVHERNGEISSLQDRHGELVERLQRETAWQEELRDDREDILHITREEIEAWQQRDEVSRRDLRKRKRAARDEAGEARRRYDEAHNEARVLEGRLADYHERLLGWGVEHPLAVPDDYDYKAVDAVIRHDEEEASELRAFATREKTMVDSLLSKLARLHDRLQCDDAYHAVFSPESADFDLGEGPGPYVTNLEERAEKSLHGFKQACDRLDGAAVDACDAVSGTGEHSASRFVSDSARRVREECETADAMRAVATRLVERSRQFSTMAKTLKNKLRATDEAVDDLVNRSVEEGYILMSELRRLVQVSTVRIAADMRQPTIRFRCRGRYEFQREQQRDDVATERLARQVRSLITETLPAVGDVERPDIARRELAPHELVYGLLGDRSVEVQYPVIRGGKSLSYESARDTGGSGSTGQKSAGYVLSFLALLRYLGKAGALSSEESMFVALENQFGKISSTAIIRDIKTVVDQTGMQLITVAGRELASAYEMGDVTYQLYSRRTRKEGSDGTTSAVLARTGPEGQRAPDAVIDFYRATRSFENLLLDI